MPFRHPPHAVRFVQLLTALVLAMGAPGAIAATSESDHPALSKMTGAKLDRKADLPFESITPNAVVGAWLPGVPHAFEGKVTRLTYTFDTDVSPQAIYKNHLQAISDAGGRQLNHKFDASDRTAHATGSHVFELPIQKPPAIVILDIGSFRYDLTIIEPKPLVQSVKAGQLSSEIQTKGYATLYIGFDTNKSALKSDGLAAVGEIAALMKAEPSLKLSIEGHTDNVGSPAANKKLSEARATSVREAVGAQGIAAARLKSAGFGQDVPVADNRTEDGRAKNRRVELVKIK